MDVRYYISLYRRMCMYVAVIVAVAATAAVARTYRSCAFALACCGELHAFVLKWHKAFVAIQYSTIRDHFAIKPKRYR